MTSRKIEMEWRCSACGQRNLGRHTVCERCGDPKGANEPYEMPSSTAAAPTVTDPALLRLANAGANWRCAYCGSDQRRLDGACEQCGAAQAQGRSVAGERPVPPKGPPPRAAALATPRLRTSRAPLWLLVVALGGGALVLGCVVLALIAGNRSQPPYYPAPTVEQPPPPRRVEGVVTAVSWEHTVHVERWRIVEHEGFAEAQPADAMQVRTVEQRVHHHDRVPDGFETESYTEQVPYQDTETYTEQVQCGEDCTDSPQQCTETCTPDNNGFANCTTSCTGGGRSCSPRYCTEPRTRQVTRYRTEPRTRQVPRFRDVPVDAPWLRWRVWEWTPERDVTRRGSTEAPAWPDEAELSPPAPLGPGEQERSHRNARYQATVTYEGSGTHQEVVSSPEELQRYAPGSRWELEVGPYGASRLIGPVAVPVAIPDAG